MAADSVDFAATASERPDYVKALEATFGPPSRKGFGSTVLFALAKDRDELERLARAAYTHFVGDMWDRWGEAAWMGSWRLVYKRTTSHDIATELNSLDEPQSKSSADMLLNGVEDPDSGKAVLAAAFDGPTVRELLVFNVGDGSAMSGLLIAAQRFNGETVFLVFLMD